MKKKLTALFLAVVACMNLCAPAFAIDNAIAEATPHVEVTEEIIYVEDSNGNLVPIILEERTEYPAGYAKSEISPLAYSPEVPVGTTKTYTVKVSNDSLSDIAMLTAGATISTAVAKEVSKRVANAIAQKIGSKFLPGLNLALTIAGVAAWANMKAGNQGFQLTVTMIYSEYYSQREGYYIYGYDFDSAAISVY